MLSPSMTDADKAERRETCERCGGDGKAARWPPEHEATLRHLWPDYRAAAAEIGCSPGAAHNKGMRLGLAKTRTGNAVKKSGWRAWMEKRRDAGALPKMKKPPSIVKAREDMKRKPGRLLRFYC